MSLFSSVQVSCCQRLWLTGARMDLGEPGFKTKHKPGWEWVVVVAEVSAYVLTRLPDVVAEELLHRCTAV